MPEHKPSINVSFTIGATTCSDQHIGTSKRHVQSHGRLWRWSGLLCFLRYSIPPCFCFRYQMPFLLASKDDPGIRLPSSSQLVRPIPYHVDLLELRLTTTLCSWMSIMIVARILVRAHCCVLHFLVHTAAMHARMRFTCLTSSLQSCSSVFLGRNSLFAIVTRFAFCLAPTERPS